MSDDGPWRPDRLHWDVLEVELPAPELLARYVMAPNELTEDERREVEVAIRVSRRVADEVASLRTFDFARLNDDL